MQRRRGACHLRLCGADPQTRTAWSASARVQIRNDTVSYLNRCAAASLSRRGTLRTHRSGCVLVACGRIGPLRSPSRARLIGQKSASAAIDATATNPFVDQTDALHRQPKADRSSRRILEPSAKRTSRPALPSDFRRPLLTAGHPILGDPIVRQMLSLVDRSSRRILEPQTSIRLARTENVAAPIQRSAELCHPRSCAQLVSRPGSHRGEPHRRGPEVSPHRLVHEGRGHVDRRRV